MNENRFLLTVIAALLRGKSEKTLEFSFDNQTEQLYLDGNILPYEGENLAEDDLENRIQLLARRLGIKELTIHHAAVVLRSLLEENRSTGGETIIRKLREAALRKHGGDDRIEKWREALNMRILNAGIHVDGNERLRSVTEDGGHVYMENGPLLEDWPRRLLEHKDWAYADEAIPGEGPFRLDDIWTDLQLIDPNEDGDWDGLTAENDFNRLLDERYERRQGGAQPAGFLFEQLQGTVAVVGPPGSGKTTMLKWLARQLILNPESKFLLPLFVSLRRYVVDRGVSNQPSPGIVDYALQTAGVRNQPQRDLWRDFLERLTRGRKDHVLFLLDGWDEVPADVRPSIRQELEDLSRRFSMIVTSRPSAYPRQLYWDRYFEIAELSEEGIHTLIKQWFRANKQPSLAESVLGHLEKYPDLKRLARNPFLLTLICGLTFHRRDRSGMELPLSRTQLYRELVRRIIGLHDNLHPDYKFTAGRREQLEKLAYWLFTDAEDAPRYMFESSDLPASGGEEELLEKVLKPSRFINRQTTIGESYYFLHTTFQEYFAACCIAGKKDIKEITDILLRISYNSSWQEIARFAAGREPKSDLARLFWCRMRQVAAAPDRFGFIYLRLARFVAETGRLDGGAGLLGIDLREKLWDLIISEMRMSHYVDAYALLDADGFVRRAQAFIPGAQPRLRGQLVRAMGRVKTEFTSKALNRLIIEGGTDDAELAADQVERVLDERGLRVLLEEAGHPKHSLEVRRRIIFALGVSRRGEVLEVLYRIAEEGCSSPRGEVVGVGDASPEAIAAIGYIGGDAAAGWLTRLFEHAGEDEYRMKIVAALGKCRCLKARDYLLSLLPLYPGEQLTVGVLTALEEIPINLGSGMLAGYLRHTSSEIRCAAAGVMATAAPGQDDVTGALSKAAWEDPEPVVRTRALDSLKRRARIVDADVLVKIIESPDRWEYERANALSALVNLAFRFQHLPDGLRLHRVAYDAVCKSLEPEESALPLFAAQVAWLLGNEIAPRLLETAADSSFSPQVREDAVASLGKLKHKPAEPLMLELMRLFPNVDSDEDIMETHPGKRLAQRAAQALTFIKPELLLDEKGTTAHHALFDFSIHTGSLVFKDFILDASGKSLSAHRSPPGYLSGTVTSFGEGSERGDSEKQILILSANSKSRKRLRSDEEIRAIKEAIRLSNHKQRFGLNISLAVQFQDIRRALLHSKPHIVHFIVHGTPGGVLTVDDLGFAEVTHLEALASLFKLHNKWVECVVFGACSSEKLAETISEHIPYVIGMREEVEDRAALEFSVAFYEALGAGRSIEDAFKAGCQAIEQRFPGTSQHKIPILKKRP